jgi:hypothetical protein
MLPEDANEGDWISLEGMGAYTAASQSRFNGFYSDMKVEIDPSMSSSRGVWTLSSTGESVKISDFFNA